MFLSPGHFHPSRAQRLLNRTGMWHGVAAAWVRKYMSCGLRWFKTGRMWHQWQPGPTCFWYVCFDSQLRPHGQARRAKANPKTSDILVLET